MISAGNMVRIAMLNTDLPVPNVRSQRGSYGNVFFELFKAAAQRIAPETQVQSEDFDVVQGEYPKTLSDFDAILITGSASSTYDDVEWIHRLDSYVRDVYEKHPDIKIFGSCFGHQLVCQSLLKPYGGFVEKDPNGWELGVRQIELSEEFRKSLAHMESYGLERPSTPEYESGILSKSQPASSLRLQLVHSDHVRLPSADKLPKGWMSIGKSKHTIVQGVYEPGRVLCYQGHFEFDRFINTETLKVFGSAWDPAVLAQALSDIDADDDSEYAAEIALRFVMGLDKADYLSNTGLLTPPAEMN